MVGPEIQQELQDLVEGITLNLDDEGSYCFVYGSGAYSETYSNSDIDVLFAVPDNLISDQLLEELRNKIIQLHMNYKKPLDNEVPYESKLIYSHSDISNAFSIGCFVVDNSVIVPEIVKSEEFLASPEIKSRLFLNACTTPNIILGNATLADKHTKIAGALMTIVGVYDQRNEFPVTKEQIFDALVLSPSGNEGEMYLGYKVGHSKVRRKLHEVITSGLNTLKIQEIIEFDGEKIVDCLPVVAAIERINFDTERTQNVRV